MQKDRLSTLLRSLYFSRRRLQGLNPTEADFQQWIRTQQLLLP